MVSKNINIYCVLKQPTSVYTIDYVKMLEKGVTDNTPDNIKANFFCLSNYPNATTKLKYNWPGWWSKMELFRPDIKEDFLYMDLDTVIYSNLEEMYNMCFSNPFPIMIAPFHTAIGSGVMWLPEKYRGIIWNKWIKNPEYWMKRYRGDQDFIAAILKPMILLFQDIKPNSVVSFKLHCKDKVPDNAMIICYHGKPKPHETNWATTSGDFI